MDPALAGHLFFAVRQQPLRDFLTDPALTLACVLLIVVSIGWIAVARSLARTQKDLSRARRTRAAASRSATRERAARAVRSTGGRTTGRHAHGSRGRPPRR